MPKKKPASSILKTELVRAYRSHFNSAKEVSKALGVSKETALNMLMDIADNKLPVTDEEVAKEYIERLKTSEKYLSGDIPMTQTYEKRGKNYIMQDFKIEAGKSLPSTEVTENPYAYQIIIKGKMGKGTRNITTTYAGDPQTALDAARHEMSRYYRFSGVEMFMRVISDISDERDIDDDMGDVEL